MAKRQRTVTLSSNSEDDDNKTVDERKRAVKRRRVKTMGCLSSKTVDQVDPEKNEYTEVPSNDLNEWTAVDYIQRIHGIHSNVAEYLVELFNNDNTIPFIARYRKTQTNGLDADELRAIKESFDKVSQIKNKATKILKSTEKQGKLTPELKNTIISAKTISELELIQALYKVESKKCLADRDRELGLEYYAKDILKGEKCPDMKTLIDTSVKELGDEKNIKTCLIHILADMINKDKRVFDKIIEERSKTIVQINTKKTKSKDKSEGEDDGKYKMYYDWSMLEKNIKPHHILALNRAEAEKVITVQVVIPHYLETQLENSLFTIFDTAVKSSCFHRQLIIESFRHLYKKSIAPAIIRRTRNDLKETAEEASMEVFAINLKNLLLTSPVRGEVIMGIDPGYAHGCKLAVISLQGNVLDIATIYPCRRKFEIGSDDNKIAYFIKKYKCSVIALGNGTACRETEGLLSKILKSTNFASEKIRYVIVNEAGASVYSCSSEAKSEFAHLDYNLISAVSIARRLQDPLAELVKIDPKHLGVGMYQHDLPEKQLMSKLNEVVTSVVSLVGVDINTASHSLLKRVAGITDTKATNIIQYRRENGSFINREHVKQVKGIGSKTFQQCAGFIRIIRETAELESAKPLISNKFNPLDETWIHPESYGLTHALIKTANVTINLGDPEFTRAILALTAGGYESLANMLDVKADVDTLDNIVKGLTAPKETDPRHGINSALFRKSLRNLAEVTVGTLLTGEIRNVVHFGAFVDVGVETDGLIHISKFNGIDLRIGQRVDVKVLEVDQPRKRLSLALVKSY